MIKLTYLIGLKPLSITLSSYRTPFASSSSIEVLHYQEIHTSRNHTIVPSNNHEVIFTSRDNDSFILHKSQNTNKQGDDFHQFV